MLTRRCTQRQFLLTPNTYVTQTYEYVLAEAAQRFNITLFGWVLMSNHQHVAFRDNDGNFPEFIEHLDKMISSPVNRYLGRRENLWSSEQANVVWLVEAADKLEKLIYILTNPVAAHLVDRVQQWPGSNSLQLTISGKEKEIARPRGYFRKDGPMPATVKLRAARLEGFEHLSQDQWETELWSEVRKVEKAAKEEREKKKIGVLGRKAIRRARPTDTPEKQEERSRLTPTVACKDATRRQQALDALRAFRAEYAIALRNWLSGTDQAQFPVGTYRMMLLGIYRPPPMSTAA